MFRLVFRRQVYLRRRHKPADYLFSNVPGTFKISSLNFQVFKFKMSIEDFLFVKYKYVKKDLMAVLIYCNLAVEA